MKFEFDIEPVEQARPRATRMGKGIRLYDPKKVNVFKQQLGMLARQQMLDRGLEPYDGPLEVRMGFYRPVQTSVSKKERARRLSGVHRPTVKPDLSNYIKALEDGLNGILWVDDNLIVSLQAEKLYSELPHLVVEIRKAEQ
ncbi:RusA family crossover junction endodeoxyribonuclease [Limosilactobacillus fermentum]